MEDRSPVRIEPRVAAWWPAIRVPYRLVQPPEARDCHSPAQRLAIPVAVLVAVFTFTVLQVLHKLRLATGADFLAMLHGASDLASGKNLYEPALRFLGGGHLRGILSMQVTPYVYPPLPALALRPLTLVPQGLALVFWDALNVSLLGLLFVLIVRVSQARSTRQLLLAGAIYGFFPLNIGLGTGQVDLTLTILGLTTFLLYRSGRLRMAGAVLGVMALVKPTIGIVLIYYLCRRAWPVIWSCVITLAVGVAVSLAAVGGRVLWEYRTVAVGWANDFGVLPLNQSLHGVIMRLLAPRLDMPPSGADARIASATEVLLVVVAIAVVVKLLQPGEPARVRQGALQFYGVFSVLLLGIPFTEDTHFSWLLPGAAILLVTMEQQRRWHPWHTWAVSSYMLLALPFAEAVCWGASDSLAGRLTSNLDCYGLIALSAVLCFRAFGQPHGRIVLPLAAEYRRPRPTAARGQSAVGS